MCYVWLQYYSKRCLCFLGPLAFVCVWVKSKGREQQSSLLCEAWHPSTSACYISMTRSVSGRAAAVEHWERGETGGCGVDRTGWGRGEVSRRTKAGLKGTRKGFYFSQVMATFKVTECVCACACTKGEALLCKNCNMQGYVLLFCTYSIYQGCTIITCFFSVKIKWCCL